MQDARRDVGAGAGVFLKLRHNRGRSNTGMSAIASPHVPRPYRVWSKAVGERKSPVGLGATGGESAREGVTRAGKPPVAPTMIVVGHFLAST